MENWSFCLDNIKLTLDELRLLEKNGRLDNVAIADSAVRVNIMLDRPANSAYGSELHEFYTKGWDGDYYYESEDAVVQIEDEEGNWIAKDDRLYDLKDLGTLGWQGATGSGKWHAADSGKPNWMTFEDAFLKWKANKK